MSTSNKKVLKQLAQLYKSNSQSLSKLHKGNGVYCGAMLGPLLDERQRLDKEAYKLGYSLGDDGKAYKLDA